MKTIVIICEAQRQYNIAHRIYKECDTINNIIFIIAPESHIVLSDTHNAKIILIKRSRGIINRFLETVKLKKRLKKIQADISLSFTSTGRWDWIVRQLLKRNNKNLKCYLIQWAFLSTTSPNAFKKRNLKFALEYVYAQFFNLTLVKDRRFGTGDFDYITSFGHYWSNYFMKINPSVGTIPIGNPEAAEISLNVHKSDAKTPTIGLVTGASVSQRGGTKLEIAQYVDTVCSTLKNYNIIYRPHPKARTDGLEIAAKHDNIFISDPQTENVQDYFERVDVIISVRSTLMASFMVNGGFAICFDPNKNALGKELIMKPLGAYETHCSGLLKQVQLIEKGEKNYDETDLTYYLGKNNFYNDLIEHL